MALLMNMAKMVYVKTQRNLHRFSQIWVVDHAAYVPQSHRMIPRYVLAKKIATDRGVRCG